MRLIQQKAFHFLLQFFLTPYLDDVLTYWDENDLPPTAKITIGGRVGPRGGRRKIKLPAFGGPRISVRGLFALN